MIGKSEILLTKCCHAWLQNSEISKMADDVNNKFQSEFVHTFSKQISYKFINDYFRWLGIHQQLFG